MAKQHKLRLTLLIFLIFISLGLPDSIMGSGWPSIRADFNLQARDISIYTSVGLIFSIITSYFYPFLTKYLSLKQIITLSIGAVVIGLGIISIVPNALLLFLAFPFLGMGQGAIDVAVNIFAAKNFSKRTMSFLHGFYGVGASLSSLFVAIFLKTAFGWRGATLIILICQLVILLSVVLNGKLFIEEKEEIDATQNMAKVVLNFRHYLGPLFYLFYGVELVVGSFLSTYMREVHHLSSSKSAAMTALFLFALTLGRFTNGLITHRLTETRILQIQFICSILGIVLLTSQPTIASFLIGYGFSVLFPMLMSMPHQHYEEVIANRIVNLQMTFANIGILVLPVLFGFLIQAIGFQYFPLLLSINIIILIMIVVGVVRVKG